ncbi:MAG: ABC transporter ATP-binding protein [Actinobacteria bacterium]|nr:ABC transporter ATP-binding protein [Actinomycetota bacterium]
MALIKLENLHKRYGTQWAVKDVSIEVKEGTTCVILGPSGSGKSSVLKMINRLIEPDSGRVFYKGKDVKEYNVIKLRREMGYAVQNIGLFPHLTVEENISLLLKEIKWSKQKIKERAEELLILVGLEPKIYLKKYPSQLSGGEAQRVGVARALSADPPVLLMDEPFGALDPITRRKLQDEFARIKSTLRKTTVFVTHDIYEAVILADEIALMKDGELIQKSDPFELWQNPKNEFVMKFLGNEYGFHILSKYTLQSLGKLKECVERNGLPVVNRSFSLKDTLSLMLKYRTKSVVVEEPDKRISLLTFDEILSFVDKKRNLEDRINDARI